MGGVLPAGSVIPAGGRYVGSPDPVRFEAVYGFAPDFVYTGSLSNSGEEVTLADAALATVDTVTYADTGEWPAAQPRDPDEDDEDADEFAEYDPLERFTEKVFRFNYNVDRFVLKPVARVYNAIMPEPFQVMVSNGFDNIGFDLIAFLDHHADDITFVNVFA